MDSGRADSVPSIEQDAATTHGLDRGVTLAVPGVVVSHGLLRHAGTLALAGRGGVLL